MAYEMYETITGKFQTISFFYSDPKNQSQK